MSDKEESIDTETQTRLHVFPHTSVDEDHAAVVYCERVCQTAVSSFPEVDRHVFYSLLEFIPYKDITQDAVRIVDLPRKPRLQFRIPDDKDETEVSSLSSSESKSNDLDGTANHKGVIKRKFSENDEDNLVISVVQPARGRKETTEKLIQTNLTVLPHVLDEEKIANVYTEVPVQTTITLVPKESYTVVVAALDSYQEPTRVDSLCQTSDIALKSRANKAQVPTTSKQTETNENDVIGRTAETLAGNSNAEDNIKEILKFTTDTISREIAKIANTDNKCHCPGKPETQSASTTQRPAAGRQNNIKNVNKEGDSTKAQIRGSDKQKTGVGTTAPKRVEKVNCNPQKDNLGCGGKLGPGIKRDVGTVTSNNTMLENRPGTSGATTKQNVNTKESVGDHKSNKRVGHIDCECHPSGTGAAPSISPIHTPVNSTSQIVQKCAATANTTKTTTSDTSTVPQVVNIKASGKKFCFKCDVGVSTDSKAPNRLKISTSTPDNTQVTTIQHTACSNPDVSQRANTTTCPYITLVDENSAICESCGSNTVEHQVISCVENNTYPFFSKFLRSETGRREPHSRNPYMEAHYKTLFKSSSEEHGKSKSRYGYGKQICDDSHYQRAFPPSDDQTTSLELRIRSETKRKCSGVSFIPVRKNKTYKTICASAGAIQGGSDNFRSSKLFHFNETAKPKESVIGFPDDVPKLLENSINNIHTNFYTFPNVNFELKERETDLCNCNNGLTPPNTSNSGNLREHLNKSHIDNCSYYYSTDKGVSKAVSSKYKNGGGRKKIVPACGIQ